MAFARVWYQYTVMHYYRDRGDEEELGLSESLLFTSKKTQDLIFIINYEY